MEVSTIVKDNLGPSLLVNEVKQAKGADVDSEVLLQINAAERHMASLYLQVPMSPRILS